VRRGARDLATRTCLSMSVAGARDVHGRNLTVSRCWLWCACHDADGDADGHDRFLSCSVPIRRPVLPGNSAPATEKTEVVRMRVHHAPRASTQEQVRLPRV